MKKNLLFASCFLAFGISHAQESLPIKPFSSVSNISDYETSLSQSYVGVPHLAAIQAEDAERDNKGQLYRVGVLMPVDFTFSNTGTWSMLPNGDKVWRLQINAPNAQGTALYFDNFYLPAGSRMHVYSPDRDQMLGAFTSYNNHPSGIFATSILGGESCIIEYYEPVEVTGQGQIHLNEVAYVYRSKELFVDQTPDVGSMRAGICEVDVKCPEGTAWADQIRGICRIQVKVGSSIGWCSGSAINNTLQDCTPYVLTAQHCGQGATTADFNAWVFRFNYQKASCGSGSTVNNSMTGAALIANSNDGSTGLNKGDFILCETNNPFPSAYNVYFNGWDNQNTASPNGVGIHHPAGDVKKISTYTTTLVSSGWSASNTHWRVIWAATATNWGVTEGGSSGSPIFNTAKLICGQLSGGSSFCDGGPDDPSSSQVNQDDPDLYGKFSFCWTSSGTTSNRQLKPWLDPINSGVSTMNGKNNVCTSGQEEFELENIFSLYPNPASDELTIESTGFNESVHTVAIYDQTGKLVNTFDVMPGMTKKTVSLQNLKRGVYNVVISNGDRSTSRKFVKM